MYEITAAMVAFIVVHLSVVYVCLYVLSLSYPAFVVAMVVAGVVSALLVKAIGLRWKTSLQSVLQKERAERTSVTDSLGGVFVLLAGAVVSQMMIAQRFGLKGWAGLVAANMAAHALA
jgi:hypothetical protein